MEDTLIIADNGGRRSGVDRRQFTYSSYVPERRSGRDRRSIADRRSNRYKNIGSKERRSIFELI